MRGDEGYELALALLHSSGYGRNHRSQAKSAVGYIDIFIVPEELDLR